MAKGRLMGYIGSRGRDDHRPAWSITRAAGSAGVGWFPLRGLCLWTRLHSSVFLQQLLCTVILRGGLQLGDDGITLLLQGLKVGL